MKLYVLQRGHPTSLSSLSNNWIFMAGWARQWGNWCVLKGWWKEAQLGLWLNYQNSWLVLKCRCSFTTIKTSHMPNNMNFSPGIWGMVKPVQLWICILQMAPILTGRTIIILWGKKKNCNSFVQYNKHETAFKQLLLWLSHKCKIKRTLISK